MQYAKLFLGIVLIQAYSGPASAGDPKGRLGRIDTDRFPEIEVVYERPGEGGKTASPAPDAKDVFLLEDGRLGGAAVERVVFRDLKQGVAIAVLVDVSGSMRGKPLEAVRDGLQDAVKRARASDRVRLATIADELRWETAWNDSAERVRGAIENLEPRGTRTRIWDGLQEAASELTNPSRAAALPERKRILLISDGHDEDSKADPDKLTEALRDARTVIDVIVITTATERYLGRMSELAEATGGSAREAADAQTLKSLVSGGIDHVLDMPVYRFRAAEVEADGKEHRFSLQIAGATLGDDMLASVPKLPAVLVVARRVGPWAWGLALIPALGLLYVLSRRRKPAAPPVAAPRVYQQREQAAAIPEAQPAAVRTPTRVKTELASGAHTARPPRPSPPPAPAPSPAPAPAAAAPRPRTMLTEQFDMPAPGRPVVVLEASEGPRQGTRYGVDSVDFWIGAAPENNLSMPDDATLSGMHARIRFSDNALRIHDNGSTNGTWLNGAKVDSAGQLLSSGDSLRVGSSVFRVVRPDGKA